MAKIKTHPKYDTRKTATPKPKGIDHKAFEKVYWPFIPVFIATALLLSLAIQTVPLHHLTGKVLGYQTSKNSDQLLKDTNLQREKAGESDLKINDELTKAAQAKADDMAKRDYWSHNTPQGVAPWSFVTATGYVYQSMGENLAAGFNDDDAVVNAWMASPHHRENILDKNYSQVGFGYANNPNYTAAGGGPMTIVVAFYAQPASVFVNPKTNFTGQTLGASTTRVAAAFNSSLSPWLPVILLFGGLAALGIFIEKHRRYFATAAAQGERYILRHPATDFCLLIIACLVFLLNQTAGFIK
ncbi:MAG TPA: CAP domain-containing protein [Candidatus Saccharimonadales bacterium]|nr:CAP domain-containing protein [Candidatus Saccharimonadales bacterium]